MWVAVQCGIHGFNHPVPGKENTFKVIQFTLTFWKENWKLSEEKKRINKIKNEIGNIINASILKIMKLYSEQV